MGQNRGTWFTPTELVNGCVSQQHMVIHGVVIHPQWNSFDFEWSVEVITTSTGHKLLPPYIRVIQGDGLWLRLPQRGHADPCPKYSSE